MLRINKWVHIFGIILLALILRLIALSQSFWLDETVTAVLSIKPVFGVNYAADFQPPLFYVIAHYWQMFGIRSEWFLRLPSVFFGIASIYVLYIFTKKLFDKKTALISALLLATAPYHIYYSQEFRMYSFFSFLVLLSWFFLWEKRWLFYAITICLASFTHYFIFLVIISQFVYILLDRRITIFRYVAILVVSFLPFLFWLPTLHKQLQTASALVSVWPRWREVSNISFLKFPFLFLAKTTVGMTSPANKILYAGVVGLSGIIFILALCHIIVKMRQASSFKLHKESILFFCYFFIPLILAWFSGLFIAANSPHRLTFVLPAFYAILAVGLTKQKNVNIAVIAIGLILSLNIFFTVSYLFNPQNHREDWQQAVSYTDKIIGDKGIVLSEFNGPLAPMEWYSKKPEKYSGASTTMQITSDSIKQKLDPVILHTPYLILYTYLFQISDPQQLVEKYMMNHHFKLTEEKDYRGVGIIKTYTRLNDSL